MKLPAYALPALAGLALLGVIVLAALGADVPDVLKTAVSVLVGGAAGQAVPTPATAPAEPEHEQ